MSHSAENCKRGTLRDLLTYIQLQNIKNKSKVDPLVSAGFVGYVKVKNERGPFGLSFALAGLGLSGFRKFSKKWTDQCEVCGLKKKSHCYSRAFFLKRKTRRLKTLYTDDKNPFLRH